MVIIRILGMDKITVEGNITTHTQEIITMILEEEFHLHLDTIKTMATRILLLRLQVLGSMGNLHQHMLGVTSLHHMEHNSGSSDLVEARRLPQDLTHSNHKTVMAHYIEALRGPLVMANTRP